MCSAAVAAWQEVLTQIPGAMLDARLCALEHLLATMVRAGVIAPLRPDKYVRIMAAAQREIRGKAK